MVIPRRRKATLGPRGADRSVVSTLIAKQAPISLRTSKYCGRPGICRDSRALAGGYRLVGGLASMIVACSFSSYARAMSESVVGG